MAAGHLTARTISAAYLAQRMVPQSRLERRRVNVFHIVDHQDRLVSNHPGDEVHQVFFGRINQEPVVREYLNEVHLVGIQIDPLL